MSSRVSVGASLFFLETAQTCADAAKKSAAIICAVQGFALYWYQRQTLPHSTMNWTEREKQITAEAKAICGELLGQDPETCNWSDYHHGVYDSEAEAREAGFEQDVWGITGPDRVHVVETALGFHAFTF